jgi:hypothetical protein
MLMGTWLDAKDSYPASIPERAESFVVAEMEDGSPHWPYVTHNVGTVHHIYPSERLQIVR